MDQTMLTASRLGLMAAHNSDALIAQRMIEHPMTAAQIVLALASALDELRDGGAASIDAGIARIAKITWARGALLAFKAGDVDLARSFLRKFESECIDGVADNMRYVARGMDCAGKRVDLPHIAVDEDGVIWGHGKDKFQAQADAGWHLTEFKMAFMFADIKYIPCSADMGVFLAEYGTDMPWHIDHTGHAVPGEGRAGRWQAVDLSYALPDRVTGSAGHAAE